ncbi:AraC family transcriptional regulator [Actinoallomurus liliacearum]|uniref:AraC family transcriptional regulator n=1 Tax=Actinoallomurus liliacearum TaxID=1080073 RepID=UPI0031EB8626
MDDSFTVRTATHGGRTARTALIAPRFVHQLIAHGRRMVFCYLDATSARERVCRLRMTDGDHALRYGHRQEPLLVRAGAQLADSDSPGMALRWLDLAGAVEPGAMDSRIGMAARYLREQTNPVLSADELAARAGLSTSRFLHLFREHAGTSFRRYRLWARMLRVGALLSGRQDLTTAAVEAGFASPSHFSDSFHAMFGLQPSRLLAVGVRIRLLPTADLR